MIFVGNLQLYIYTCELYLICYFVLLLIIDKIFLFFNRYMMNLLEIIFVIIVRMMMYKILKI